MILWLALRHHGTSTAGAAASSSPSQAAVIAPLSSTSQTSTPAPPSMTAAPSTAPASPVPSVTSAGSGLAAGVASVGGGAVTAHQITNATAGEAGMVLFGVGSAVLDPRGRAALAAAAATRLRAGHTGTVTVTGFANDHTSPAANTALAQARAAAVARPCGPIWPGRRRRCRPRWPGRPTRDGGDHPRRAAR